jgi:hypothetical protein
MRLFLMCRAYAERQIPQLISSGVALLLMLLAILPLKIH